MIPTVLTVLVQLIKKNWYSSALSVDKCAAIGYNILYIFLHNTERFLHTMKRILLRILPLYGILPILSSLLLNFIVYFGNRILTTGWRHYDLSLSFLDDKIPFQTWAIVIYVGAYIFWAVGFLFIARDEKEVCYEIFSGELIGKLFCLLFFLLLPTMMADRPSGFASKNVFDWLTQWIYSMDAPDNLFPSIHCMESWVVVRGVFRCQKLRHPAVWRVCSLCMAFAVFASTLLVKQHVFLDVPGGIAVAELGLLLSRKLRAGRIFPALEKRMSPKYQAQ